MQSFSSSPFKVSWYKDGELLLPNKIVVERQGNRHSLLIEQVDFTKTPKKADGQFKFWHFYRMLTWTWMENTHAAPKIV